MRRPSRGPLRSPPRRRRAGSRPASPRRSPLDRGELMFSQIAGTGGHLPERIVTNHDLERTLDTSDEWIRERTGIERRRIAADHETTVDLAEPAARRAIEAAGVQPEDVDFIVFGTTTPDYIFPNCGALLQHRLGC